MDPFQNLFGTTTVRRQRISNFEGFILSHVPYGLVDPRTDIKKGLVQYDGPLAAGIGVTKPPLQWHFGGTPYPITKAMRIDYTYSMWDGSAVAVNASIFIGFQGGFDSARVLRAPQLNIVQGTLAQIPRLVGNQKAAAVSQATAFGLRELVAARSTASIAGAPADFTTLDTLIRGEWVPDPLPKDPPAWFDDQLAQFIPMEFDGPAQNYDSHDPFAYTQATLFTDKPRYAELLWWYFAGKSQQVTKAIRIPIADVTNPKQQVAITADTLPENTEALFIGFTGPGTCPNC
jgi:hypothetical protein